MEECSKGGLSGMNDTEVLAVILSYSKERGGAYTAAKKLVSYFGGFSAVLDAMPAELMRVGELSESDVVLLKMLPQLFREYMIEKLPGRPEIRSPETAGAYLLPFFLGETMETCYALLLDENKRVIECRKMATGDINVSHLNIRSFVFAAMDTKAKFVVAAHNHPAGFAIPSDEDRAATKSLYNALASIGVELADHIIVADNDFVSLAEDGFFDKLKRGAAKG